MKLPRLQYVTHPKEQFDELSWVHRLKENGCDWIQLRIKEEDYYALFPNGHYLLHLNEVAERMRTITTALEMKLTINDLPEVAQFVDADGCHVGLTDLSKKNTLDLINFEGIIGGSINVIADLNTYANVHLSYVGVGPLRNTTTKLDTKSVLGLDGYRSMMNQMESLGMNLPVFAIGNVQPQDVEALCKLGVYGIAVSGEIFNNKHSKESIRSFTNLLS